MKKTTILLTIFALIALLSACGGGAEDQVSPAVNDSQGDNQPANELPLQTALIIGTFKLEGTLDEVSSEQAAELLPLWQVLKSLLESDTTAAAEVGALTNQIADTMTAGQIAAIETMELSVQDMQALNQELGLNEGFERPEGAETGESVPQRPEGMGPGGGQGRGAAGETGLTPEQMEAMQATREAGGGGIGSRGGGMMNTALIDALIELLQSK